MEIFYHITFMAHKYPPLVHWCIITYITTYFNNISSRIKHLLQFEIPRVGQRHVKIKAKQVKGSGSCAKCIPFGH